jgi:copper chaperone CopZ
MSSTVKYAVTGLTCGHCVGAVTSELSAVPSVTDVAVDLVVDGASTVSVTSDDLLDDATVREALDEAGDYVLVGRTD